MRYLYVLLLALLLCSSCKRSNPDQANKATKIINFELKEGESARAAIVTDTKEAYFEEVRMLEMSIQMSEVLAEDADRNEIYQRYTQFLKDDVASFNEADKKVIQQLEDTLNVLLKDVKKEWIYPDIYLVKLNAQCYGNGVFYTRDNGIFIPYDQLENATVDGLLSVFLHEIFHIMSRYSEDFRRGAYSLIGFTPVEGKLNFPKALDDRVLLNPDGVDMSYAITLETGEAGDEPVRAIPVIHSNSPNYNENKPAFFGYIQFDLFRISDSADGYNVNIGEKNGPMEQPDIKDLYYPSFFNQIYDNTQYIIHPDEIMADNFMFAIFARNNVETIQFSDRGSELQERFQNLIFVE